MCGKVDPPVGEACTSVHVESPVQEIKATCSVHAATSACTCECERMGVALEQEGAIRKDREEVEGIHMGEPLVEKTVLV